MDRFENISPFLDGALLVASPSIVDPRFAGAVIFICTHSDRGAMGLVINKPVSGIAFADLAEQLDATPADAVPDIPVLNGGPVERSRGFVLHSPDYALERATLDVTDWVSMTGHAAVLRELIGGTGPDQAVLALGYSNWAAGQLEQELRDATWLVTKASAKLIFDTPVADVWDRCLAQIGVNPAMLHSVGGTA